MTTCQNDNYNHRRFQVATQSTSTLPGAPLHLKPDWLVGVDWSHSLIEDIYDWAEIYTSPGNAPRGRRSKASSPVQET